MGFVNLFSVNISSGFFFSHPHRDNFVIFDFTGVSGGVCVHVCMSCVPFNSSMSESYRAHCALTQTLCSTGVGFRPTKIKTALYTSEVTLNILRLEKNFNPHRQRKQSSV